MYPAREDILPCGECLNSGTRAGLVGYLETASVEDPGLCMSTCILSHNTCVINDSKCRFLREFMGSSVGQYSMPLSSSLQILLWQLLPSVTAGAVSIDRSVPEGSQGVLPHPRLFPRVESAH